MQQIDIIPPLKDTDVNASPIVLVLGFFDGVHRGHQAVIAAGRAEADKRHLPLAVMTFNEHPAIVYGGADPATFTYLSTKQRKAELMAANHVDILYTVHFTPEFAKLDPQSFVDQYLVGLNAAVVVAGFDYTYGKKDIANMTTLPRYAQDRFEIVEVRQQSEDAIKISSTRVRAALAQANVDLANELLGYTYTTTGVVVHGEARGRTLGFPTANIESGAHETLPGIGIFTVTMVVDGKTYGGMASVGRNVTFGNHRPVTLEINLFDFDGDLYGKDVVVRWYHYLRGEIKFAGVDGLIEQLKQDERNSRAYLDEHNLLK
ncbi:riboflavin biosynthesis protein RibF [Lacticaseibacillus hulanensis]|uniref:riboflavin biosynthesis protein RibF n=1 Tax=Lacticaseibacillus hulanensis TaxID=2493111 RepID=UPI000FDA9B45|nr:riboflavin biosynthesis protein RibF [Lacticaseibacillus hulanensis]